MSNLEKRLENLSPEKRELILQKLRKQQLISKPDKDNQIPSIVPVPREQTIPLSFAQQRLWFLDQLEGGSATYNMPGAFQLTGSISIVALEQAIREIVRRHEALRTTFKLVNGSSIQVIDAIPAVSLPIVDLQALPEADQLAEVQRLANEEAQQPFDLSYGSLLRTTLLRLGKEAHVLLVTMHHIVSDGWSLGIFIRELSTLYKVFIAGELSPLPELPIQYSDFAYWQRQWMQGEVLERQLNYWKQQLEGIPPLLELPTDYPRPPMQTFRGSSESFELNSELTEKLKGLSQKSGATLFMTLLSAFAILLSRYSRQEDITIGTPIANRNRKEIEPLIGFFVNTLVLRANLEGNLSFLELLNQVRQVALDAYAHQDVPFEQLVEALQPERNLSHSPLFQVMFALQNAPMGKLELPGLTITPLERRTLTSKFDLFLSMEETEQGLRGEWEYNTDLFERATITRMIRHFQTLLEAILTAPEQRVGQLHFMTEPERHQILVEWNNTQADYSQDKCIHQLFEAQVEQTPELVAVVFEEQQTTYGKLNSLINQLAHYLQELGVESEILVGIYMEPSLEMIVALLGILKAGGAYVLMDTAYPRNYLTSILKEAQPSVLLTQQHLIDGLPNYKAQLVCLDSDWNTIAQQKQENPLSYATSENLAYVSYSSSRGILVEHRGINHRLDWLQNMFSLSKSDSLLHKASLVQNTEVLEIFWPLTTGSCLVIATEQERNNPLAWQRLIAKQKISIVNFLPSELSAFVESLSAEAITILRSLRLVLCSGEQLRQKVVDAFYQYFSGELHNLYSLPEAAGEVTSFPCNLKDSRDIVPIGYPTYRSIYILDQHLQPVPVGVKGEIYTSGINLIRGSFQGTEEMVSRLVDNPFSKTTDARLFKTDLLGRRLNDGTIELVGSINRQVWIKGFWVDLQEVETALLQAPTVEDCQVLVRETETFIPQLVAYVVLSGSFFLEQLESHMQTLLPGYMLPSIYVPLNILPLKATGQVDEQALVGLEVIDSDLVQRWQEKMRSLPEVEQVAVLVQEQTSHLPPLHLSDLLPEGQVFKLPTVEEFITTPVARTIEPEDSAHLTLAVSDGGPLILEEDVPKTLTEALIRTATQYRDKGIVYIQIDGSEVFQTYSSLLEEAKCILNGLSQMGVRAGDRAILQFQSLQDYFPTLWACILGGITPVTVAVASTYDQKNAVVNKLFNIWKLLGHPTILASDSLIEPISRLKSLLSIVEIRVLPITQLRNHPPFSQIHPSHPEEVVFYQLTSGSTGIPKCIQETHQSIITHINAAKQFNGYTSEDVSLNWLPTDHVVPLLTCHFKDIYLGCQQVEIATDVILANPLKWLDLMEKYRVTHTWAPNFGFKLVSDALVKAGNKTWNLAAIKFFMNAGEQVTLPVVREFLKLLAPFGVPDHAMQPAFGMAEVCTCMTYQNQFDCETGIHRIKKSSLGGRLSKANKDDADVIEFVDLGPPVPGVQIRITDENNQVLPEGFIGRFQIKGDVVTPGYLNNEAANQEAFVGEGWFNSGDLGFILNGRLTLTGREKEQIIIHAVNYYCYEIEDIVNGIDGVEPTYVAACGFNDSNRGTEGLAIFFTPKQSELRPSIDLIKSIRVKVNSDLGISPTYVIPIVKQEFPKTTSGKIQRTKLKNLLADGHFQGILKGIDIELENENTIPDWFYRKIWRQKEGATPITNQFQVGCFLVFLDDLGLGEFVCRKLQQRKQLCICVEVGSNFTQINSYHYRIVPGNPDHYRHLLECLAADKIQINQILHLWTYDEYGGEISSLSDLEQVQEQGLYSLLFLVQALAKVKVYENSIQLQIISSHTQFVSPTDEIAYEKAPILGLIKTIPQEMPWLNCRHIDLPVNQVETNSTYVLQESRVWSKELEVVYRNEQRWVPRLEKVHLSQKEKQALPFKSGGIYLISGGLGGIGVEIAKYLLINYQARLLLVGRTSLPKRNTWDLYLGKSDIVSERIKAYLELEKLEGNFIYEAVDICDLASLQKVVDHAKSYWGRELDGVIHLAGAVKEHLLVEETKETVSATLSPKVGGTWALHQILKDQSQAIFISFSSVNGFFGGFSVGSYAAANSFLEHFSCYQRQKNSLQSYCFAWSMWDELGISQNYQMKDLTRTRGYHILNPKQGMYSFLASLHCDQAELWIGLDGNNPYIRRYTETEYYQLQKIIAYFTTNSNDSSLVSLPDLIVRDRFQTKSTCHCLQLQEMPITETGIIDRKQLENLADLGNRRASQRVEPQTEIERQIAKSWEEILNCPNVGLHDNFFALGGHSLRAAQVVSRVREDFAVELSIQNLFEEPTVAGIAKYIEKSHLITQMQSSADISLTEREEIDL